MHRVTISLDETLAREFDLHSAARGYQNRSEAIRDLVREAVGETRLITDPSAQCVANLSYIFNHHERSLAGRLLSMQNERHDLVAACTRVPLDHDHCMESLILKGQVSEVQAFADELRVERGVRFGQLNLIPVEANDHHSHDHAHSHHGHVHLSPFRG